MNKKIFNPKPKPMETHKAFRHSVELLWKRKRFQKKLERTKPILKIVQADTLEELEAKANSLLARGYLLGEMKVLRSDFFELYIATLILEGEGENEEED